MAKRSRKLKKTLIELEGLVAVTFAEDIEQATDCEILLKSSDIPVVIKQQYDDSTAAKSIAVMVPERFLDEAHVVIESQNAYDDFYDSALEDADDSDLDSDLFDEVI